MAPFSCLLPSVLCLSQILLAAYGEAGKDETMTGVTDSVKTIRSKNYLRKVQASVESQSAELVCQSAEQLASVACLCRLQKNRQTPFCINYFGLLPSSAGANDGLQVMPGTYPWFAMALRSDGSWDRCTGSLVAAEYVVTAANCVYGSYKLSAYEIGSLCANQPNNCGQKKEIIDISKIYIHPKYKLQTADNDIALVRLASRSTITPVTMDHGNITANYTNGYNNLYSIGFGASPSTNTTSYPGSLIHAKMAYVPSTKCNSQYDGDILSSMICAADPNRLHCNFDSGASLFDANTDVHKLVGIYSWGSGCAQKNYTSVYSRIANQWAWIKSTICDNHSAPIPLFCITPPPPIACQNDNGLLQIVLKTDDFGDQNYFQVYRKADYVLVAQYGLTIHYGNNQRYTESLCLPKTCYTLVFRDILGDGLCCDNGRGFYQIFWNGVHLRGTFFQGGFFDTADNIGVC